MKDSKEKFNFKKSLPNRFVSIDILKALAIIGMIFANAVQIYTTVPWWLKHAELFGVTWVDLVAPGFLFMFALNFRISYYKSKLDESLTKKEVATKYLIRYFVYFILGILLSIRFNETGLYFTWDILCVISISGIILFFIKNLHSIASFIIGLLFLLLHNILLLTPIQQLIFNSLNRQINQQRFIIYIDIKSEVILINQEKIKITNELIIK